MKGKLETIMIQNKAVSTQSSFAANADYRSEAELLQDYPKQEVENIKKKALSFEHPTRGCIVYQDVCFNAAREDCTPTIDPCMHGSFLYSLRCPTACLFAVGCALQLSGFQMNTTPPLGIVARASNTRIHRGITGRQSKAP